MLHRQRIASSLATILRRLRKRAFREWRGVAYLLRAKKQRLHSCIAHMHRLQLRQVARAWCSMAARLAQLRAAEAVCLKLRASRQLQASFGAWHAQQQFAAWSAVQVGALLSQSVSVCADCACLLAPVNHDELKYVYS